jgi:vitamin K-dependent gamma-carboxylase
MAQPVRQAENAESEKGSGLLVTIDRLVEKLVSPIDIAPLVWFRVLFGLIMVWETYRYYSAGWITRYYIEPTLHFKYYGFHWVHPWPGDWMYLHFAVLAALGVMIMLGLFYRVAAVLFCIGFWYVFFLDSSRYLNHMYLVGLMSFIMIFIPAHRTFSIDAWLRPKIRSATVPAWALWWLRIQLGIVYTYAGIAKLNADWLRGEPMRIWLGNRTDTPIFGQFFTEEWMIYLFTYGGMALDLFIFPLLLWRKTLPFALAFGIFFHVMNAQLFGIGIFPWFMIASMVLFLPNEWLRLGGLWKFPDEVSRKRKDRKAIQLPQTPPLVRAQYLSVALIAVYLVVQVGFPLRHHVYPGDVAWNEDGHRFSWRMMLRTKHGDATFYVTDTATGQTWTVDQREHLVSYQRSKMPTHPDMILQYSHAIADMYRDMGYDDVEVRAEVNVSLNGRPREKYVDPDINLAAVRNTFRATTWVTPRHSEPLHASAR